jgi:regulatory protein
MTAGHSPNPLFPNAASPTERLSLTDAPRGRIRLRAGPRPLADLSPASVVALGLRDGDTLTPHIERLILERAAFERARAAALNAIARRPLSVHDLRARLAKRGFEPPTIDEAVASLTADGFLSDESLARQLVREQTSRAGAAPAAAFLEHKLAAKGVDPATARRAIEDADLPTGAAAALAAARERAATLPASLTPETKARRLYTFLARRGFEEHHAAEAVQRVLGTSPDNTD